MKYRNYEIEKQILPGADFKIANGIIKPRAVKSDDCFYTTEFFGYTGMVIIQENTLSAIKKRIDDIEKIV